MAVTYATLVKCQQPKAGYLVKLLHEHGIAAKVDSTYGGRVAADIDRHDEAHEIIKPFRFDRDDDPKFIDETVPLIDTW